MPHKDPTEHKNYSREYYRTHPELRKKQTDNKRLQYWRQQFIKRFNCSLEDCKKFTEKELREQIGEGVCRV